MFSHKYMADVSEECAEKLSRWTEFIFNFEGSMFQLQGQEDMTESKGLGSSSCFSVNH